MLQPFTLEVVGLDEVIKAAEEMGANVMPLTRAALTNSLSRVQSEVRSRAAHKTGTMQRSVLTQQSYPNGQVMVDSKQGIFNELGTGIYGPEARPIVPKVAKALAWKSGGRMVFARSIKGMKKQPFFIPGVEAAQGYIEKQFLTVMDKIIVGLGGR